MIGKQYIVKFDIDDLVVAEVFKQQIARYLHPLFQVPKHADYPQNALKAGGSRTVIIT